MTARKPSSKGRSPYSVMLAALRRRADREIKKIANEYRKLSPDKQQSWRGQALQQQINMIQETKEDTYLGRNFDGDKLLKAREAGNSLESMIGKKGIKRREEQSERRDRVFRSQIRFEESRNGSWDDGTPTDTVLHGQAGKYHFERLFYISTEDMWRGKPVADRDKAIMAQLGVSSMEEAYELVISAQGDAIAKMKELGLAGEAWEPGDSDPIRPYIVDASDIVASMATKADM